MSLYRTFIALRVPATPELGEVLDWLGRLGPAVRPVRPECLHLTLKFLGETPAGRLDEIVGALTEAVSGWSAFGLVFRGIGRMPPRRPRVIFADLADPDLHAPLVAGPAAAIEESMEALGFARERRPYRPHLTLARIRGRPPAELDEIVEAYAESTLAELTCAGFELIRSDLGSGGARYTSLARLPLSG
jgi:2'-5' RNA ligase